MTQNLIITAKIHANPDKVDYIKNEAIKLLAPTRAEEGCLQYDLQQDQTDPALFLFYERWENRVLWQAHLETSHLKHFLEIAENNVQDVLINEMTLIS